MALPTPDEKLKNFLFPPNLILSGYRGSMAHNMYVPNTDPLSIDDVDLMGVFLAPADHYIGLKQVSETKESFIDQWDVVSYEFVKFVKLLLKSNPNVISLLWLKDEFYLDKTAAGQLLLDNKDLFMSKDAYFSFIGYANGQLRKMTSFVKEGYMGQKRKALVAKFGYDCKNASHCIRLLKMGIEFLKEGQLNVFRTEDVEELLSIKKGEWPLEEIKKYTRRLFDEADAAFKSSTLPRYPDRDKANELVKQIVYEHITKGG